MTSFEKRMEDRKNDQAAKAKIKEMKDEKETIRQVLHPARECVKFPTDCL
jgi:hypothetical protein